MSSSMASVFILSPILLLGLFLAIAMKDQVPEVENTKPSIVGNLFFIGNFFGGIIGVLAFLNNLFGAILLGVVGLLIIWQGKLFNDVNWVSGNAARFFGFIWLVVGVLIAWFNIK